jgi:hypothetical protein
MDMQEAARALFGRKEPEAPAEPLDQPTTGPVIPGQELAPDYVNKTSTSAFIDNLFNN